MFKKKSFFLIIYFQEIFSLNQQFGRWHEVHFNCFHMYHKSKKLSHKDQVFLLFNNSHWKTFDNDFSNIVAKHMFV